MTVKCKMTGKETELPCSVRGCPLFGDCLVEYEKAVQKPKTNADRIRAMTDEGLALNHSVLFEKACKCNTPASCTKEEWSGGYSPCAQCVLEWLKQPAEGE